MIRNLGQVAAIYIGSSAPRNTNLIWLDNTVVPFVFRAYDGSAWSEIATHKWVRAYVDGWLVTLPPRQLADDGDYMLINSNNVNYKITVKDFVKSAVGNPLDFKGVIRVSADFPNPSTLESGDMYVIITSPAGGTVTDPYSGKTFEDSEKIVWDEVTQSWESLGKIDITVDLTTSYSETEVTIHSSAGKETTIQGATDQLAGVMLPGQYSWLQALSNGSIVPGDPSPLTPLTPAHKHNYNDIINRLVSQQGTGESTIDPMSQKATTDALNLKFDKASVLQVSGAATDKVMSQKAVTDALKTLSDDFNNKLTNYLPLAGGTMKGNIVFNNNLFLNWKDTKGSTYQVLSMKSNDEINIGNASFPLNLYSKEDLFHKRNGESAYKIWDAYNLPDPATLSGNNTFTGNNTFQAGKFNVGSFEVTSSGSLLSNINTPAGSAWSRRLVFRANNDIPSSLVFGGYNSVDNTSIGYVYIGIGDINHQTAQYKFYSNQFSVSSTMVVPESSFRIFTGSSTLFYHNKSEKKVKFGNSDSSVSLELLAKNLYHSKYDTASSTWKNYTIYSEYNLPNPATSTDLANYLPLAGGTLTGQLTIKQSVDIKLRLQSTDADNHCIIQAINAQASQLGVFGYAGDKWAIGHGGTYYEIWDKYNLTNPVRYALDASNYPTLLDSNGSSFSYIKAGPNGILPNTSVSLGNGGSGDCGTESWSFNAAYINHIHTNKISFGTNGAFIDNQSGDSSRIGIGFYNSNNGAASVYMGSLCVSDSYASDGQYKPTLGIYSKGHIRTGSAILFLNNTWTNDLAPNRNSVGYLQVLDAYDANNAGGPTNYGTVLQINSRIDHWANQLWFPGGAEASKKGLYYRHMPYNSTTYGEWIKLATTSDLGNYLPLSGGTLSGNLTINTVGSTTFVINNNDTNGSETFMRVLRKGTASAAIGFRDSLGAYIYNYNSNKYLFIDNDGYARVGTTSGSTKLALITDIPSVSGYLPLTGGTLTGTLSINSGGSEPLVINNSASAGEAYVVTKTQGTTRGVMGWNSSLGMFLQDSRGYTFSMKADGVYFGASSSTLTKLPTSTDLSGYLPLAGGTMTGALTMSSRRHNIVVDVVGGAGNTWDEGAGALSVQVPNDAGQTPLLLARRSGAAIDTTTAAERLLSMELLDNGHSFIIGMSGSEALQLDWTSGRAGTGKLFGKTIATTDQIPSIPNISISNSGSGNAVTAISASGHTLTVTKGATYLTSSSLDGYATQTWANGQFAPLSRFNTSTGYTTIKVTGQEFNFDSANPEIYMNYRTLSGSTAVTKITWKAGGGANSTALCEGRWGNLYMNDNLVATQSWAAEKFPNKTGTGASGTWGISISGNATTATNSTQLGGTAASSYVKANDNISRLTNDSGYTTQEWVNSQNFVKSTSTKKVTDIQPVDALPATQASGVLYLVFG